MLAAMWVKDWRTTRLEAEIFLESKWLRQVNDEALLAGIEIR